MSKIGPTRASRLRKAIAVLRDLVSTLPSPEEKAEIEQNLAEILRYLSEAKTSLAGLPSSDDMSGLLNAANRLEELLDRAELNPAVARAVGLERPNQKKPTRQAHKPPAPDTIRIMDTLAALTPDQARDLLLDRDRYSLSQIRAAAEGYGIRIQSRWSRDTIAGKIVSHLANLRGYRLLRGS